MSIKPPSPSEEFGNGSLTGYTSLTEPVNPVYRQFADRITADARTAAGAGRRSDAFDWLTGDWLWSGFPVHFQSTPFGIATNDDTPFLIHHAASGMWLLVLTDPSSFGILVGLPLRDGKAAFSGDVTIEGIPARLRQKWTLQDDGSIEIVNYSFDAGTWEPLDRSRLRRLNPSA